VSLRFYPDDVILANSLLECLVIFYPEGLILNILIAVLYCISGLFSLNWNKLT
jgi:hypothetical protein